MKDHLKPIVAQDQINAQIASLKQVCCNSIFTLELQVVTEEESKDRYQEEVLTSQCILICNVMKLVSTLGKTKGYGTSESSRIESEVVYRSDYLHKLFAYLQHQYGAVILFEDKLPVY